MEEFIYQMLTTIVRQVYDMLFFGFICNLVLSPSQNISISSYEFGHMSVQIHSQKLIYFGTEVVCFRGRLPCLQIILLLSGWLNDTSTVWFLYSPPFVFTLFCKSCFVRSSFCSLRKRNPFYSVSMKILNGVVYKTGQYLLSFLSTSYDYILQSTFVGRMIYYMAQLF